MKPKNKLKFYEVKKFNYRRGGEREENERKRERAAKSSDWSFEDYVKISRQTTPPTISFNVKHYNSDKSFQKK